MPVEQEHNAVQFKDQIPWYLHHLQTRNRAPAKPATLALYRSFSKNHVLPTLGDVSLEGFTNGPMKAFAADLVAKKLSAKTVSEICLFVRSVIASAVDSEGNQLHPRVWNHRFVDLPPVKGQRQPHVAKTLLQKIVRDKKYSPRDRVFVATLASTGLRLGEILALRKGPSDPDQSVWDADNCVIRVRKSVWRGQIQEPKTSAAVRDVNLYSGVNEMLKEFTERKAAGEFLFSTRNGRPLPERYIRLYILRPMGIEGAHALRRFRVTHLRGAACPDDLTKVWLGHAAGSDITTRYSKLSSDDSLRRNWTENVGVGFELPSGHPSPTAVKAAHPKSPKPPKSLPETNEPRYVADENDLDPFFHSNPVPGNLAWATKAVQSANQMHKIIAEQKKAIEDLESRVATAGVNEGGS